MAKPPILPLIIGAGALYFLSQKDKEKAKEPAPAPAPQPKPTPKPSFNIETGTESLPRVNTLEKAIAFDQKMLSLTNGKVFGVGIYPGLGNLSWMQASLARISEWLEGRPNWMGYFTVFGGSPPGLQQAARDAGVSETVVEQVIDRTGADITSEEWNDELPMALSTGVFFSDGSNEVNLDYPVLIIANPGTGEEALHEVVVKVFHREGGGVVSIDGVPLDDWLAQNNFLLPVGTPDLEEIQLRPNIIVFTVSPELPQALDAYLNDAL
jgi:hypothetical protein